MGNYSGYDKYKFHVMKKILLSAVMVAMSIICFAQSANIEPEYIGQVVIVNSDSTTTLLQKEEVKMKTKSTKFGLIPVPGSGFLDKTKAKYVIKGKEAPVSVKAGRITLIVKAANNEEEPRKVFGIMKFDVEKKERTYLMAEGGVMSGTNFTMNFSNVPFVTKKYGKNCYLVVIENAEPGEYAVNTDFSNMSTFSVKE